MTDERPASKLRLTAVLCAAEILGMAGFATFSALLPGFLIEWRLTNTDAGWVSGIFYAGNVYGSTIAARIYNRQLEEDLLRLLPAIPDDW